MRSFPQVPELAVQRNWFTKQLSLDQISIHDYILDHPPTDPLVSLWCPLV